MRDADNSLDTDDAYTYVYNRWCRLFAVWLDWGPERVSEICELWRSDIIDPDSWFWHDGMYYMAAVELLRPLVATELDIHGLNGLNLGDFRRTIEADLMNAGANADPIDSFHWDDAIDITKRRLAQLLDLTLEVVRRAHGVRDED